MTCPHESEQLDSYLDGESEPGFTTWFDSHQEECANCRNRVVFHRSFKMMVRQSVTTETTPELVRARLMRALDDSVGVKAAPVAQRTWHRHPWVRPALAAASLAAVSTAAVVGLSRQPKPYALAQPMASDHTKCCREVADRMSTPNVQFGSVASAPDPVAVCRTNLGKSPEVAHFPALSQCDVRMCPIQGHKALHMVYQDDQKHMVSMFGLPETSGYGQNLPEAGAKIQPALYQAKDYNLAAWKRKGWVYSLVAEMPADELGRMATQGAYTALCVPGMTAHATVPGAFGATVQPVVWTGAP